MVTVELYVPGDERVAALLALVPGGPAGCCSTELRWSGIEVVAVASVRGQLAGLATLAPADGIKYRRPTIVGMWVVPRHRRLGVATALLVALAAESQRRYRKSARIQGITADAQRAIRAALARGADLVAVYQVGKHDLGLANALSRAPASARSSPSARLVCVRRRGPRLDCRRR